MALLSFIFVARWIRETKGRKLEEVGLIAGHHGA